MQSDLPRVSVIVPVFNDAKRLPALVESLRAQEYPADRVEILLVDNGSTDGSLDSIRSFENVTALSQTDVQGPAPTRNAGIGAARGDVIAFLDSDCRAEPQWLSAGVAALQQSGAEMAAGRIRLSLSVRPNLYEIYDAQFNMQQDAFVEQGWAVTANLFVRREVFDRIGCFDPALYSFEDKEFGLRATRAGFRLVYAKEAVAHHDTRKTLKALVLKWIRTEYGAAQAYRSHGEAGLQLWKRKANWRPLVGVWKRFPEEHRRTWWRRRKITLLANLLRYAGNLGNFLGYYNICKWVLKG